MAELSNPCAPCSVEQAIHIVGGKWKLYLIRILIVSGPQRFNDLLHAVSGISHKVLTENLRALEDVGVIAKVEEHGKMKYAMTISGQELQPVLHALGEWFDEHSTSIQN